MYMAHTRSMSENARWSPHEEDARVNSSAWKGKLREAEADIAAGRVHRFDSDDDFLGHLERLDAEADG
jgi:hypothetical protein